MRQYLENIYSMIITVWTVCTNYSTVWAAVVAFSNNVTNLKSKIDEIEVMKEAQETDITGFALDKKGKRMSVIKLVMVVAGGLKALALATSDNVLFKEASYTRSDYKSARDTDFVTMCKIILKKGNENKAALEDYGVTGLMLTNLDALINEYDGMVQDPRTKIAERKGSTKQLDVLIDEADDILEILDNMVEQFAETNVDFYNAYKNGRIIVDVGIRHKKPATPPPTP